MKNFSKKLSFVMAAAMVVTSLYAPQNAEAAAKNAVVLKGSTKTVKSKNIYLSGNTVDFDAVIKGKKVKDSAGKWTTSNKKVAAVDKKGVVKVVDAGTATIKFTDKKSKKTVSVKIYGRVRASKMMLTPAAVMVKEGESADVTVNYELSKKVQAANGKATTYKLFAESSNEDVATVSVDGNNKVMVKGVAKSASPVSITLYAAQVDSLAKAKEVKIKLTEKFDVKVSSKLSAEQAGANKIKVMGSEFVASKAAFVVKNSSGVALPLKDEIKLNEAKTEAVLEGGTTQIPVGKYTLSYNNSDPVEFEVVKAVVKSIVITPTGKAIMGRPNNANKIEKAYAYYKVLNQFGEDITKSPLAARIQVTGSDNATMGSKGKIEFTSTSTNGYQLNLSQVSVAVVDVETGVNANAILTTGEASKVWETEYKGLFDLAKRKFVENISESDKLANLAILIGAKDQYGNTLVHDNNKGEIQVNLLSITGVNTDSNKANVKIVSVGDDEYYAYTLKGTKKDPDATADRAGEVSVQSIVINNGKMENHKFNVVAGTKVDTLNVRAGALGVYEAQDNWLDFTALDAEGKELTNWDSLKELNNSTNMPNYAVGTELNGNGRKLMFVKKSDGKVGLLYNPGNSVVGSDLDTASITQVLSFISKTNKFSSANLTVRKKRMPVSVIGIASDTVRGTTATKANRDFVIKAEKIKFQDQYGNTMTADDIKNVDKYQVAVTLENKNLDKAEGFRPSDKTNEAKTNESYDLKKIDLNGNGTEVVKLIAMSSAGKSATGVAKVTLKLFGPNGAEMKSSEEKSFEIYNARLQDMSSFSIEDPGLKAAHNHPVEVDHSSKGFEPSVIGYYAGYKVSLLKEADFTVYKDNPTVDSTYAPVPDIDPKEGNVVKKAIARVIINNDEGTKVDREFSYSREARRVAKAEMNGSANAASFSAVKGWDDIKTNFNVVVKDQYGAVKTDANPYITFSDFDKKVVTIDKNGTNGATIKVDGKTALTVKFAFPGSSYVFEKVISFE